MRYWFALLVGITALVSVADASARELVIEHFDARIAIDEHGGLHVRETLRVRFIGSWQGISRKIPLDRPSSKEALDPLQIEDVEATEQGGGSLRTDVKHTAAWLSLRIHVPRATDVVRTLVLEYTVENGVRPGTARDELFWNVVGDGWEVPIRQATANVLLPEGARGVEAHALAGKPASKANVTLYGQTASVAWLEPLEPGEMLTLRVSWDQGAIRQPSALARALRVLGRSPTLLIVSIPWILTLLLQAYRRWPLLTARRREAPPEDLTPAEVAFVVRERVAPSSLTATIVDLAIRGYLRIHAIEGAAGRCFAIERQANIKPRPPRTLQAHEQLILDELPNPGWMPLTDLSTHSFRRFKTEVSAVLAHRRYRSRIRSWARHSSVTEGVLSVYVLAVFLAFGFDFLELNVHYFVLLAAFGASLGLGIAGVFVVYASLPRLTPKGRRARHQGAGFAKFLGERTTPRAGSALATMLFDRFLPHALALGLEPSWASSCGSRLLPPLRWFSMDGRFQPIEAAALFQLLSQMACSVPDRAVQCNWWPSEDTADVETGDADIDDAGFSIDRSSWWNSSSSSNSSNSSSSSSSSSGGGDGGGGGGGF